MGERTGMTGLIPRCSPGAFASALHVLRASPWLAFPPLPVYRILCHFFSALISSPAEGGRRLPPSGGGGDCLGSQPWGSRQGQRTPSGHLLCPHPMWRTAPAPLVVSPSNSPPPLQPGKVQMELTPRVVVSSPPHITGGETEAQRLAPHPAAS